MKSKRLFKYSPGRQQAANAAVSLPKGLRVLRFITPLSRLDHLMSYHHHHSVCHSIITLSLLCRPQSHSFYLSSSSLIVQYTQP